MALRRDVRQFLSEPRFAVLATIAADGMPHQTVVWYELRDDEIIMNTAAGRVKEKHLRRDPRVSICIEDAYRAITIRGAVTLVDDQTIAQADIHALAVRYNGPEKAEQQMRGQFSKQHRVTIRLPMSRVLLYGFGEDA
ncbi:MAG: hypothetical protein OJF49_000919 [Ktedonobacterales bacterium]|nr:MAG: hypothetical protein OJF49_000919 [Ktedonobacterales bacterium]